MPSAQIITTGLLWLQSYAWNEYFVSWSKQQHLRRLKNDGFADIYYGNESGGPTRKYYKITDNGKETLAAYIEEWEQLKSIVSELGI